LFLRSGNSSYPGRLIRLTPVLFIRFGMFASNHPQEYISAAEGLDWNISMSSRLVQYEF